MVRIFCGAAENEKKNLKKPPELAEVEKRRTKQLLCHIRNNFRMWRRSSIDISIRTAFHVPGCTGSMCPPIFWSSIFIPPKNFQVGLPPPQFFFQIGLHPPKKFSNKKNGEKQANIGYFRVQCTIFLEKVLTPQKFQKFISTPCPFFGSSISIPHFLVFHLPPKKIFQVGL